MYPSIYWDCSSWSPCIFNIPNINGIAIEKYVPVEFLQDILGAKSEYKYKATQELLIYLEVFSEEVLFIQQDTVNSF